jgi:hypothetical protein
MKPKIGDFFIIIIAVTFVTFLSLSLFSNPVSNKNCHIITPDKEYIYPLNTDQTIEIKGPLGLSRIQLKNNCVRMLSSPCPLKICVKKGEISNPGEWIACLPNNILIIIKGNKNEETRIDILSQ